MACNDWFEFDGTVLVNAARTVALSRSLGIDTVRIPAASVDWIEDALPVYTGFGLGGFGMGGFGLGEIVPQDYDDVTTAPWYDAGYPASGEFAGFIALDMRGLDDSTLEGETVEYTTDGANVGKRRNASLTIVANFALIAKTERGAEFGKRWLDRVLRASGPRPFVRGTTLRYSRWASATAPIAHRRNVALTRGTSVTRRKEGKCAVTWMITFTLTALDPFEYGQAIPVVSDLGGVPAGAMVNSAGGLTMTETPCPQWDYSPLYDPQYPALVPPPEAPDFLPAGWTIEAGDSFYRHWVRTDAVEPSALDTVPVIKITSTTEARMLRVSVWPGGADTDSQCDPLFSVVVSYLPANTPFYIDAEQSAAYIWDGYAPVVRRADSLVYSPDANPVEWRAFNDPDSLLITLDTFAKSGGGYEGDGNIRASVALVPKSD